VGIQTPAKVRTADFGKDGLNGNVEIYWIQDAPVASWLWQAVAPWLIASGVLLCKSIDYAYLHDPQRLAREVQ
jgi:hypothetical protein